MGYPPADESDVHWPRDSVCESCGTLKGHAFQMYPFSALSGHQMLLVHRLVPLQLKRQNETSFNKPVKYIHTTNLQQRIHLLQ